MYYIYIYYIHYMYYIIYVYILCTYYYYHSFAQLSLYSRKYNLIYFKHDITLQCCCIESFTYHKFLYFIIHPFCSINFTFSKSSEIFN